VLGRPSGKTVGGTTTRFLHDGEDMIGEASGGVVTKSYTWGPEGLLLAGG
jgi:hypothetical protein